jgi:hypothetical protein
MTICILWCSVRASAFSPKTVPLYDGEVWLYDGVNTIVRWRQYDNDSAMVTIDTTMVCPHCTVVLRHRTVVLSPSYCCASPSYCPIFTIVLSHFATALSYCHHCTVILCVFILRENAVVLLLNTVLYLRVLNAISNISLLLFYLVLQNLELM